MSASLTITKSRLERLVSERGLTNEKIEDVLKLAEDEQRDPNEFEREHLDRYRTRAQEIEVEIGVLADELERGQASRDVSALIRRDQSPAMPENGGSGQPGEGFVYRTFAEFARDDLIVRYPLLATAAAGGGSTSAVVEQARERQLRAETHYRTVQNTTTAQVAGLLPPTHINQIMDLINKSRPVVETARQVNLSSGQLTYPQIAQRPTVTKQAAEKTEAGTANMQVTMGQIAADTYLGAGDLSWQTISWSSPDALMLWFDLAAEAYARQTETAACSELGTAGGGTTSVKLGTAGTESFDQWRAVIMAGLAGIYAATGGRAQTDTLYLSADKFFSLAGLGSANVVQISSVGALDIKTMSGVYSGLRVVGSYGFAANTAVLGDSSAFLIGENQGAPVEMRVVEPSIGGMQVGVIGAFKAKVFDANRFIHIA